MAEQLFTSESVTEGHPDKIADQISDAVLDAVLTDDPQGRVACETFVTTGLVMVGGEISTDTYVDIPRLVREKIRAIGYTRGKYGFDASTCAVMVTLDEQSPDIAQGVDHAFEEQEGAVQDDFDHQGAGDQGMMFGFACDETPELMPMPISLAHDLTRRLAAVRRDGLLPWLRPDGKAQVTVRYVDGRPTAVTTVVVSAQHAPEVDTDRTIRPEIHEQVIRPVLERVGMYDADALETYINPTGRFEIGGPMGDAGLTGRKIIVDTYGGYARHGGGAFSGKDPSKVDRSGAYAARWVAKNVVAAKLARRCEVQIAYAIGVAHPVSLLVTTDASGPVSDEVLADAVREVFDLRPGAIVRDLDLRRPIYGQTATYGHFGRHDLDLPWEETSRVDALQSAVGAVSR